MQDLFLLKRDINAQLYCIVYAGCPPLASPQPAHSVQGSCPGLVLPNRSGLCLPCRPLLPFFYTGSTHHLRSAEQGLLHVPFACTSTMQSRAFSVVGPLVWNGHPLA